MVEIRGARRQELAKATDQIDQDDDQEAEERNPMLAKFLPDELALTCHADARRWRDHARIDRKGGSGQWRGPALARAHPLAQLPPPAPPLITRSPLPLHRPASH